MKNGWKMGERMSLKYRILIQSDVKMLKMGLKYEKIC